MDVGVVVEGPGLIRLRGTKQETTATLLDTLVSRGRAGGYGGALAMRRPKRQRRRGGVAARGGREGRVRSVQRGRGDLYGARGLVGWSTTRRDRPRTACTGSASVLSGASRRRKMTGTRGELGWASPTTALKPMNR